MGLDGKAEGTILFMFSDAVVHRNMIYSIPTSPGVDLIPLGISSINCAQVRLCGCSVNTRNLVITS